MVRRQATHWGATSDYEWRQMTMNDSKVYNKWQHRKTIETKEAVGTTLVDEIK